MPTILIAGASRGIGLSLARRCAKAGWRVLATHRTATPEGDLAGLAKQGSVEAHRLDVTDGAQVAALANNLQGTAIDFLFCNAGIYGPRESQALGGIDYDAWLPVFETNVLGPMRVAEAFVDHVAASDRKVISVTSSVMASLEKAAGGAYIYRSSKAALNMAARCLGEDVAERGISVIAFHPGWVRTDMGGPGAAIDVETSTAGLFATLEGAKPAKGCRFLNYDGDTIPW